LQSSSNFACRRRRHRTRPVRQWRRAAFQLRGQQEKFQLRSSCRSGYCEPPFVNGSPNRRTVCVCRIRGAGSDSLALPGSRRWAYSSQNTVPSLLSICMPSATSPCLLPRRALKANSTRACLVPVPRILPANNVTRATGQNRNLRRKASD